MKDELYKRNIELFFHTPEDDFYLMSLYGYLIENPWIMIEEPTFPFCISCGERKDDKKTHSLYRRAWNILNREYVKFIICKNCYEGRSISSYL